MKYIKTFENIKKSDKNRPHANDYVCVDDEFFNNDKCVGHIEYRNFINDNVGKITTIDTHEEYPIYIKYKNIPKELDSYFEDDEITVKFSNILFYHKNKKDVEIYIASNKYNL